MPSITPVARASIGGSEASFVQPRVTVTRETGMGLPSLKKPPELEPKIAGDIPPGQPDVSEETDPKAVTLSPQLTALARKQQKLQQEIQALREREAALTAKEADYVPKSSIKEKLQRNAAETLKELGLDYEELTHLLLSQQQAPDPVQALKAEIDQIKSSQQENVSKQYEATLKQYKAEADALVAGDLKTYHFINKKNAQDAVVEHIVETWKDEDKILSMEEAAKDIEEFLRDEAKEARAALEELEPTEAKPTEKTLPPPKAVQRTLTQQVEAAPTRTYNQFQHLSMKERIAQAIARAQK